MSELIKAGMEVTLIGMSTVFVLLGMLVWIVQLMSRLAPRTSDQALPADSPAEDAELISVIGAAVRMFRSGRKDPNGRR